MFPNGTRVIVRSNQAGVYVGVVVKMPTDSTVTLATGTRQIHYWSAGGSVPQVAECGIASDGSRVTARRARRSCWAPVRRSCRSAR